MSQTIIRAPRRHRFLVIDQRAIEDERLSWAARGLLGYLLSKPDDWKVLVNDLRKRGDLGRDGIYRLLKELRTVGYARYVRLRDLYGRIRGGIYIIREIADSPHPESPDMVEPDTAEPGPANPEALPTTDVNLKRTTTTTPINTKERSSSENENGVVDFAFWVPEELRKVALKIVAGLSLVDAQIVLDEWAGCMAAEFIETSPLGYLQALVRRYQEGDLTLVFAVDVAGVRARTLDDDNNNVEIEDCAVDCDED